MEEATQPWGWRFLLSAFVRVCSRSGWVGLDHRYGAILRKAHHHTHPDRPRPGVALARVGALRRYGTWDREAVEPQARRSGENLASIAA